MVGFDADGVANCSTESLPASQVFLVGLFGDVSQQKLDLFEFTT